MVVGRDRMTDSGTTAGVDSGSPRTGPAAAVEEVRRSGANTTAIGARVGEVHAHRHGVGAADRQQLRADSLIVNTTAVPEWRSFLMSTPPDPSTAPIEPASTASA